MPETASRGGMGNGALAVLLILVLLAAAFLTFTLLTPARVTQTSGSSSQTAVSYTSSSSSSASTATETVTSTSSSASASKTLAQTPADPSIENGTAKITFPPDYAVIANYSLGLINADRGRAGTQPVSLSQIQSGQQHADSMLYFGYFSHWDNQGYKPYMRYTLLGGTGGMEENVAYEYFPSHFHSTSDVEQAISRLETQMIYNDSACCQNGHRDNILQPRHNRVSIGIAYNDSYVYFVEDFENYYISLSQPVLSENTVRLAGQSSSLGQIAVNVFYDKYPQPLTSTQLSQVPYQGSYDQGKFTGGVVPPCLTSCLAYPGNITVHAQTWKVSPTSVDIVFSLSAFTQKYGKGVYTVIIVEQAARPVILYDLSIFGA